MKTTSRNSAEINSSSMADIAFLLLIFFLVTTTIVSDKGLFLILPPENTDVEPINIPQKNLFTIVINSSGELLVEGQLYNQSSENLKNDIMKFVLNRGEDITSSDSPEKAIVTLKTSRATTQNDFIEILDVVKSAYNQIYANRVGVSLEEWRRIANKHNTPYLEEIYNSARGQQPDG
ncbi:MAG: biopolymer transporter ExbD, partial [Cyclobacteriaceae bacterium]|nr:biopolymer transporter ExbD [Cyclobacteriaceae bacterium]